MGECRSTGEHKYYLSNLPTETPLKILAATIKARWLCEQAHHTNSVGNPRMNCVADALRRRPLADRGSPGRTHGNAVTNPRIKVCSPSS